VLCNEVLYIEAFAEQAVPVSFGLPGGFGVSAGRPICAGGKRAINKTALRELDDGMGWKKAQYYKTIQPVDLDGDGQSELLARWIDGLQIYRFNSGALIYLSLKKT
jgi:hypothetical protein